MLCGSAFKNKGVQALLDAVIDYMPAPTEVKAIEGVKDDGTTITCPADDDAPFACAGIQDRYRPVCRHADIFPCLFRFIEFR